MRRILPRRVWWRLTVASGTARTIRYRRARFALVALLLEFPLALREHRKATRRPVDCVKILTNSEPV